MALLSSVLLADHVKTWEDFYQLMDARVSHLIADGSAFGAFETSFTMYAFLQSMRTLPEEGDIRVLIARMIDILVYHSKEILGVDLVVSTPTEARNSTRTFAAEAILSTLDMPPDYQLH